jgi:hypothetical protein
MALSSVVGRAGMVYCADDRKETFGASKQSAVCPSRRLDQRRGDVPQIVDSQRSPFQKSGSTGLGLGAVGADRDDEHDPRLAQQLATEQ